MQHILFNFTQLQIIINSDLKWFQVSSIYLQIYDNTALMITLSSPSDMRDRRVHTLDYRETEKSYSFRICSSVVADSVHLVKEMRGSIEYMRCCNKNSQCVRIAFALRLNSRIQTIA